MEASANKQVMRCIPGLSKSEKKKFRDSERMRIANLKGTFNSARTTSLTRDTVSYIQTKLLNVYLNNNNYSVIN